MASFNRVILMGNLTRDPEVRQAQNGTHITKAGLAVNERMPDGQGGWKEEASFIDVVIFGKRAEAFGRYLRKGRSVLIEGKLRQSRWQDKETQQNRSKLEVIVDNWEFVGGGREEGQGGGGGQYQGGQQQQQQSSAPEFPQPSDFGGGGGGGGNFGGGGGGGIPDDVPF
ncbi:MAG: single-stranded DNA-binding protein [Planctomycetes bacterium]|nr:single-stranded DNA-binding protein [Planctomycetota bacterium]MCP4860114.1 single-stranded DNA-binding protein [Planctomycetota bacterium]